MLNCTFPEWQDNHLEFTEVQEQNLQTAGKSSRYHLLHFDHANGLHFCHRFLWHICCAGAANVLAFATSSHFQGSERVRCRINFTIELYQDNPKFVFFLFTSFASLHLHFLMFPSFGRIIPF